MLTFTESQVQQLLPMADAIAVLRSAFLALANGEAQNQPRRRLALPTGTVLHSLAGAYNGYLGTKIYSTNPRHGAHFTVLLYDATTAAPLAQMEANILGQIRTGAASGLATDLLAKPNAATLGVLGTGFQARTQVEAVLAVRPIHSVRVWSRSKENREAFAAECAERFQVNVTASDTAEEVVRESEIVTTATNAKDPVLQADWVQPAAHVNAVGSNQAKRRELPAELLAPPAYLVLDSREQAELEAGDLLLAGIPPARAQAELAEVVAGRADYRYTGDRVTIFKSLGLGLEDVAVAAYLYEKQSHATAPD